MNGLNGPKSVSYTSSKYGFEKEIFKSEWFKEYILFPFADTEIRVPVGYDEMLRFEYGDYMQLPPMDKRIPDHERYYVNLKEGLTKDEVIKRIKAGENCVY
jgi:lipopolysaccharide cholinephosphotransferase